MKALMFKKGRKPSLLMGAKMVSEYQNNSFVFDLVTWVIFRADQEFYFEICLN